MVFETFVKINDQESSFPYPTNLGEMKGSIFNDSFDLKNLTIITGGMSAGSMGVDFYSKDKKRISAAIQARSDKKTNMLDIDCFTRKYFSDGITEPSKSVQKYPEATFHNIPKADLGSGLTIGFRNSGSEISQSISKEEIDRLFKQSPPTKNP